MKLAHLKLVAKYLREFHFIKRARRVENNIIELNFAKDESIFFDMTRGRSKIYLAKSKRPAQEFNAPFDTLLHQKLSFSKVLDIKVPEKDRILQITVQPKSQYKSHFVTLQLEFTGRYTNAILLDENGVVIEALHHIDASKSFRVVKPGVTLEPLPSFKEFKEESLEENFDIKEFLRENYKKYINERLESLKSQKLRLIEKKIERLTKELDALEKDDNLIKKSNEFEMWGNLILANLNRIRPFDEVLECEDFEGNSLKIPLPKGIKVNRLAEYYYKLARRARAKAKNIHIEEKNLKEKINFYKNIKEAIKSAKEPYKLELLVPKKGRSLKKKEKLKDGELFWIEGYKVYVGRNAKENQKLLSLAKANDIWMHTRDIPGSHIIIRTDKQNLPQSVLKEASKLCVDFTTNRPGNYEVDYTKRKFVKIQKGSLVEYDKYKTISVKKD